jgi:hypothetical protein
MRYLKYFESNVHPIQKELQEFCDNNLAYLIDIGFDVEISEYYYDNNGMYETRFEIKLLKKDIFSWYTWGQINDDFIPFLTILNSKYDIRLIKMNHLVEVGITKIYKQSYIKFPVNHLIKDKINTETTIKYILIDVKK